MTKTLSKLLGLILAFCVLWLLFTPKYCEGYFRFWGMASQLLGVLMTLLSLRSVLRQFEVRPFGDLWQLVRRWFSSKPAIAGGAIQEAPDAVSDGRVQVRDRIAPEMDVSDQLAAIKNNLSALDHSVARIETEMIQQTERITALINAMSRTTEQDVLRVGEQLRDAVVGTYQFGLLGIAFFAAGIFLTSLPAEIAPWLPGWVCLQTPNP